MCIGVPLQVIRVDANLAICADGPAQARVDISLVGEVRAGQWLLVHLGCARELLEPVRAQEIRHTLAQLAAVMAGEAIDFDPGFSLPSASHPFTTELTP